MKDHNYLNYVHSFRGFAILNVVLIHSVAFSMLIPVDFNPDTTAPMWIFNETLFHDSTIYFAMISGLLFSNVLRSRGFRLFYSNKLKNVLLPYLFCSLYFSLFLPASAEIEMHTLRADFDSYISALFSNLVKGEAQFTYWYIPVLLTLFAFTPVLDQLLERRPMRPVAWILLLLPLVFSRPAFAPGVLQVTAGTLIYFTGAYLTGMYLGRNLESNLDWWSRKIWYLVATATITSLTLVYLQIADINRFSWYSLQETFYYLQKLSIAILVLIGLRQLGDRQPKILGIFGTMAFSIYFLHAYFIEILVDPLWDFLHQPALEPWNIFLGGTVLLGFCLIASLAVIFVLQKCAGRYSRLMVGS